MILLDDLGFSHFGCYGSSIDTPNIDRLAANGLQYTNFHVTPLCSPTRASLLTGRNHHEVGMRGVSNFNTGFPHMTGHISHHAATVAEVLRDEGYATFAVGKWHLCQMEDASAAGPYDQWPCQRGFDRFYGFLDGETDQFHPELVYDNHRVDPPRTVAEGYHLSEDLVDQAIRLIYDTKSIRPDRPFFLYLAFGATHAPHQAPAEYLEKYRGQFDAGWDVAARRVVRAAEGSSGSCPRTPTSRRATPASSAWDDLPENHRTLAARLQEAFAGFLDHTDAQIGRLVDELEDARRARQHDDRACSPTTARARRAARSASCTSGSSSTSSSRRPTRRSTGSTTSAARTATPTTRGAGRRPATRRSSGTSRTPTRAASTCRASCTGRRGSTTRRRLRHQFHHVSDIVPTIYEALGVTPPDGVPRRRADAGHRHVDALHLHRRARRADRRSRCSTSR